jgi:hypothetical protein
METNCPYCGDLIASSTQEGYYLDLWSHLIHSHCDEDDIDANLADLQAALEGLHGPRVVR